MRYLMYTLYEKACDPCETVTQEKWDLQYKRWKEALKECQSRFPKRFLKEYSKNDFHDNVIESVKITRQQSSQKKKYFLERVVRDNYTINTQHVLVFEDVKNIHSTIEFNCFSGCCDWIYAEFLPIDEKHLSFEVILFSNSVLYFEFKKMHYQKLTNYK